ncbi:GIY-YIG nuclease family protein [Streptomyces sp900116325]|uniref:GIY-YIG nuclease family protein n=1 Tax=Streptomyces sp. 900116325 TaxID=3154295 RepID=UPI0033EFEC5A
MPTPDMNERAALYRLFDKKGRLLYVGISNDPVFRWRQHRGDKHWWPKVVDKKVTWYDTRMLALQAEALAIHTEAPIHNGVRPHLIAHVPEGLTVTRDLDEFDKRLIEVAERRRRRQAEFRERDAELRSLLVRGRQKGLRNAKLARLSGFTRDWVSRVAPDPRRVRNDS